MGWTRVAPIFLSVPLASCRSAGSVRRQLTPEQRTLGARALTLLQNALDSSDAGSRASAAASFGRIGNPAAIPLLLKALGDLDVEVRISAAYALWRLGDESGASIVQEIAEGASHEARGRQLAVETFGRMFGQAAFPFLERMKLAPEAGVREGAVIALSQIGRDDPQSIQASIKEAFTSGKEQRLRAVKVLAASRTPAALEALKRLANSRDAGIRNESLEALGEQAAAAALPALLSALADGEESTRLHAARALSRLGTRAALPQLEALLAEPQPLKLYGWLGLKRLELDAPAEIPDEAARSEDPAQRLEAAEALELEKAAGLEGLKLLLDDNDAKVRLRAAAGVLMTLRKEA
jgi:HEAT repeat protein